MAIYAAKLVKNDILHLIIVLLVKKKFQIATGLDFCYFLTLTSNKYRKHENDPGNRFAMP